MFSGIYRYSYKDIQTCLAYTDFQPCVYVVTYRKVYKHSDKTYLQLHSETVSVTFMCGSVIFRNGFIDIKAF